MTQPAASASHAVRVWDLPTRVFHWALAVLVVASIVSAKIGGDAMAWHFRSGYAIFALLLFRLVWGFAGGRWSRFASFVHPPSAVLHHMRDGARSNERIGHNPLGALAVFAMLGLLIAQVASGLFADDEIDRTGPLARFVSNLASHRLTTWHKAYGQWLIIALVLLHVAAIGYYFVRKHEDLLRPMWHGDKRLPSGVPASSDRTSTRLLAAVLLAACAALVAWVVRLGG